MEFFLNLVTGGFSAVAVTWLFRNWISERIRESIRHEYAQKLESHKAELNADIQKRIYEKKLSQLRTSLFFDHQRTAFAAILSVLSDVKTKWLEIGSDYDGWLNEPVPHEEYERVKRIYSEHQLFLDRDCIFALDSVIKALRDSFPIDRGDGVLNERDTHEPFDRLVFLQERLALLFQEKIGISNSSQAKIEFVLLEGMLLLNRHHFADIQLPVKGDLAIKPSDDADDILLKATKYKSLLISRLDDFEKYLSKEGFFHDALSRTRYCLELLKNENGDQITKLEPLS